MQILDALRRAVEHYPGGREAVAQRLGKTDEVLRKELSGQPTHKLGAVDALAISVMCIELGREHAHDYVAAVCSESGGRFEASRGDALARVTDPVQRVSCLMRETSDVGGSVISAMADGVVSDNELKQIESEIAQAELVLQALRAAARAVNAAGKPAHLRAA